MDLKGSNVTITVKKSEVVTKIAISIYNKDL